ncbi:cerebellar degeneration-related protein 2-like isoform X2 [Cylas formicarius]|uniref:cerebellar degeneration-related protein 2-like isoform X2 n=1 Tax=Cylas formicarius TaxID=197179 RepID=UPI002958487E|nr:cerebellar degeneration-related protein 2-like isoform X2 [Cylas formicarius]
MSRDTETQGHSNLNSLDCWDYTIELECLQDLQLAAELGKTLLERNKELEAALKQHQNIIEDQTQEIEYLTKQTAALREVNDSRLRIYEQLEVSIQDLERANHRLALDNSAEKKHIKGLNATIESLEAKCEDLQSTIDELKLQVDVLRKKSIRSTETTPTSNTIGREYITLKHVSHKEGEEQLVARECFLQTEGELCTTPTKTNRSPPASVKTEPECDQDCNVADQTDSGLEQMSQLLTQLRESRAQCSKDERIIAELEEQLSTMVQQNQALENQVVQLSHKGEDMNMKSMHEELNTLDEVRQGQMCSRCLRSLDRNDSEIPEDDDTSMMEELMTTQHRSSFSMNVQGHIENQSSPIQAKQSSNPYKELVEKYEALVEVHRKPIRSNKSDQGISLQEDLALSGDFNIKDMDEESGHGGSIRAEEKEHKKTRKTFSTPTDFSEAETSSSGFADETCNKGTQTEGKVGSFLCTIADGEDCKFSIYDDASPIDSRFRDRPEYRVLFKEIFKVLKKAAENKEEGDDLPLLDDNARGAPKVPPVTPSSHQLPEFPDDDTHSVMSTTASELSISQNEPTTIMENIIESQNQPIPDTLPTKIDQQPECVLKPLVRQPLEYLSVEVRKRSSSRRKNKYADRSDSPITHIIGSPKISYSSRPNSGRRRRELKAQTHPDNDNNWNGNTLQFWATNRNVSSPTPSQGSGKACYEFKPSTASHDLNKLKKLDMSYAEVLKRELYKQRRK